MVGSERPGTVAIYTVDNTKVTLQPEFEVFVYDIPATGETWQKLYDDRRTSMIDPEDLLYVCYIVYSNCFVTSFPIGRLSLIYIYIINRSKKI